MTGSIPMRIVDRKLDKRNGRVAMGPPEKGAPPVATEAAKRGAPSEQAGRGRGLGGLLSRLLRGQKPLAVGAAEREPTTPSVGATGHLPAANQQDQPSAEMPAGAGNSPPVMERGGAAIAQPNGVDLESRLFATAGQPAATAAIERRAPGPWAAVASTAVGASHVRLVPPVPCQDACIANAQGRPHIVLADGVGSARLSHIGAEVLVRMTSCFVDSQEDLLADLLDVGDPCAPETVERAAQLARTVTRYGASVLRDAARQMAHSVSEFQSTLLLVIVGKSGVFWSQIGDGAILVQEEHGIRSVSPRDQESFANVVTVVGEAESMATTPFGVIPAPGILGLIACSDGAAERLVSIDQSRVAGRLGIFLGQLRDGSLRRQDLHGFLIDSEVWRSTTGDDKSLGLLSR